MLIDSSLTIFYLCYDWSKKNEGGGASVRLLLFPCTLFIMFIINSCRVLAVLFLGFVCFHTENF